MKTQTQLKATEVKAVNRFLLFNSKIDARKLSDFYNSRSTKYSGIYDSDLFKISNDKSDIIASGFNPLVKKIIRLNVSNVLVKNHLKKLAIDKKQARILEVAKAKAFKVEVLTAISYIKLNKLFIEQRNPGILENNVSGMTLKPVAYWLSQKSKKSSSQAFLQALRYIYQ